MTENHCVQGERAEVSREDLRREWLGLKSASPTHYELLRLPTLEFDRKAILTAGRRVKRRLRAYQIGPYRKQSLDLLAEVGQAVSVLTNVEKKRAYDNQLLGTWRAAIEELYEAHCKGRPREPVTLAAWMEACRERGVPIARLIPSIVRFLHTQGEPWPPHGEHGLALPEGLWIYRDAVILGNCLRTRSLEKRAGAVKRVQKAMGVPEDLARFIAEEVTRGSHLFARLGIVRLARADPEEAVVRLGRRIRRLGGRVGRRSKVLGAVASLVGKSRRSLDRILPRLDEKPVVLPAAKRVAVAARKAQRRALEKSRRAGTWLVNRPQLLLGAALLVGLVALVLAILVVWGLWEPWGQAPESEPPVPFETPREPPAPPEPAETDATGTEPSEPPPSQIEEWEEFIKKYPADERPDVLKPEEDDAVPPPT